MVLRVRWCPSESHAEVLTVSTLERALVCRISADLIGIGQMRLHCSTMASNPVLRGSVQEEENLGIGRGKAAI